MGERRQGGVFEIKTVPRRLSVPPPPPPRGDVVSLALRDPELYVLELRRWLLDH